MFSGPGGTKDYTEEGLAPSVIMQESARWLCIQARQGSTWMMTVLNVRIILY